MAGVDAMLAIRIVQIVKLKRFVRGSEFPRKSPGRCSRRRLSSNSERDTCNEVAAEAVLQAIQNLFPAIANDFTEPDIAVDVHEQGAVTQASGLGVGDNGRVNEIVPDF